MPSTNLIALIGSSDFSTADGLRASSKESIDILDEVFFTGEAWFYFSGNITRQNSRIWSA
jgi:hypothetical protein